MRTRRTADRATADGLSRPGRSRYVRAMRRALLILASLAIAAVLFGLAGAVPQ